MEFAFVFSYSGLPVYVPNCVPVDNMCAVHKDYCSGTGYMMGLVEGIVGE